MSLVLDGTNGLSDVDGSAATPAIRGTDTNTGIFFPAADTIAFAEGGAEVARFDASGNLLVGTTSATYSASGRGVLEVGGSSTAIAALKVNGAGAGYLYHDGTNLSNWNLINGALVFGTNNTERARIDSSGNLLVGTATTLSGKLMVAADSAGTVYPGVFNNTNTGSSSQIVIDILRNSSRTGYITNTNTTTSFTSTSDYRLKEDVQPMTGALAKVAVLKPVTYKWKVDGSDGQGFIAHELAEVVPDCVSGEKDAVDADGKPQYQGIDTSFLVATLTAAIQELKAIVDAQGAEIAALKGTQP